MRAETLREVTVGQTTVCRMFSCRFFDKIVWDDRRSDLRVACELRFTSADPRQTSLPVVIGAGLHPFPFRTRKLSLLPPMVLRGQLRGRVGHCRDYLLQKSPSLRRRAFS